MEKHMKKWCAKWIFSDKKWTCEYANIYNLLVTTSYKNSLLDKVSGRLFSYESLYVRYRYSIDLCRDGQVRLRHAEYCAVAALLLEDSFDDIESLDVARVRIALLLDFDGIENAVLFKDNVYLAFVFIAIVVDIRLFAVVPPALHDFRDDIGLQQFASQYFFLHTE